MKFLSPPFQFYCLIFAVMIYACFSSPTPDGFGVAEILVALGLLLACRVTDVKDQINLWVALGYGLTVPTLFALIEGHQSGDILRDMIAFLYMLLAILFVWIGRDFTKSFLNLLALLGIIFSVRTILSYHVILFQPAMWGHVPPTDLLYLANSPEVLFSALYCIGTGGKYLISKGQRFRAILYLLAACLPMVAMALMTQRAGIGAVFIYSAVALMALIYRRPQAGMVLILIALAIVTTLTPIFGVAFETIWKKTEMVGLNARSEEWGAVFDVLSEDWVSMLFGEGWGGRLDNPAVGGLNVNYTHSLVSSLLLKTGVVGSLIILIGCLYPVFVALRSVWRGRNPSEWVIIGAALLPLLISIFLYASYKSLGFGLILLVFFIFPMRKLERNDKSVS